MRKFWLHELGSAALWLATGAGIGAAWGQVFAGLLVAAFCLLARNWYNLHRLEIWLKDRKEPLYGPTHGAWGWLYGRLFRLHRLSRKRKKRSRKVLSRFRAAVEATPEGAVILGDAAEIVWLNRRALEWLGLRRQDVRRPITHLVRTPGFSEYLAANDYDEPFDLVSPVDDLRHLSLRVTPYGKDRRLLLVRDVTRIKSLEQTRQDFVANVSHELRSPLTVVVGYLESMRDAPELSSWQRPIELMSQQAERMRLIVEDLLRLSSMEGDPGGASRDPVHLAGLVEAVLKDARGLSEDAHEFFVTGPDDLIVLGEYNELYSVVSNLAFNAVQYTPAGGKIRFEWWRNDAGAHLAVTDSGVGIDQHHLSRLTERFYRVDKARSRELGGTGLGLAIVKHVLVRHDSRLEIESTAGEGSCFTCHFPPARVRQAETRSTDADGAASVAADSQLEPSRQDEFLSGDSSPDTSSTGNPEKEEPSPRTSASGSVDEDAA